jgi:hypothetical protein
MIHPVNNHLKNDSESYDKANRLISLDIIRVVGADSKNGAISGRFLRGPLRSGWLVGLF